ncbi:MAG: hypothetical protein SPI35_01315 [Porphyromonas sp.]|nr:hypothetical protein [Porphyromonas sp.]
MTHGEEQNLQLLERNIRRLMELVIKQDRVIRDQNEQIEAMEDAIVALRRRIGTLEGYNKELIASKVMIANNESVWAARMQITEMIDSIDRCLKLLEVDIPPYSEE